MKMDLLSEGRFELGLGAGWIARESQMVGIPFDPASQRVGRLEEAVHVLKGLFANGPMTFAGRYYSLNGQNEQEKNDVKQRGNKSCHQQPCIA